MTNTTTAPDTVTIPRELLESIRDTMHYNDNVGRVEQKAFSELLGEVQAYLAPSPKLTPGTFDSRD